MLQFRSQVRQGPWVDDDDVRTHACVLTKIKLCHKKQFLDPVIVPRSVNCFYGKVGKRCALTKINSVTVGLSGDDIGAAGAESCAGVLVQCPALTRLDLAVNQIGEAGAESLAGVLGQCTALVHLEQSIKSSIIADCVDKNSISYKIRYEIGTRRP